MTDTGRQLSAKPLLDEILTLKSQLPTLHLTLFGTPLLRTSIYSFGYFFVRLLNLLDSTSPELLYILPELFVEIPFEIFRVLKRSHMNMYESEEGFKQFPQEAQKVLVEGSSLTYELVKFITRHFMDAKIPNPDLKETYLTRLNFLL